MVNKISELRTKYLRSMCRVVRLHRMGSKGGRRVGGTVKTSYSLSNSFKVDVKNEKKRTNNRFLRHATRRDGET